MLTAYLGLDELSLLHDELLPDYLDAPQDANVAAIALATIAYLVVFGRFTFRSDAAALLAAG